MGGFTRRQAMRAGAAGAAALWLGPLRPARAMSAGAGARFAQGVSCGQPAPDAITLWTRLDGAEADVALTAEVARDPGFADVVLSSQGTARVQAGGAAHLRISGLEPGEQYWYRFTGAGEDSPAGRFRTAPPPGSQQPVRIGFFSCQRYTDGWFTAHRGLAGEPDLDLIVSLGDYVYWAPGTPAVPARADTTGPQDSETLEEYRAKYRLYQSDPDLQAMHAAAAFVGIWDDNDTENNYAGETAGTDGDRRVPWPERRANSYRAALEHLPMLPADPADPFRIYRSVPLGANAEVLLLDTRQYRDDQACGDRAGVPCLEAKQAGRTLLGSAQKEWLKGRLEASPAAWKVIANQVMMMSLDSAPFVQLNQDQWDGYDAERRELMEHIVRRGIKDVTVLTGDIHTFFAGTVTTTGRLAGIPAATEFVGGSITSTGIPESFFGAAPRELGIRIGEAFGALNPHIAFTDMRHKGYGVLEARPEELLVSYRAPRTILEPSSETFTLQRFRVRRGLPLVEKLGA